jgi:hypothetical protein
MERTTNAPTIFGVILMLAGVVLYFVDNVDTLHNPHYFGFPAVILMGLGALFMLGGRPAGERSAP